MAPGLVLPYRVVNEPDRRADRYTGHPSSNGKEEPVGDESPFKGQTGLRRIWNALHYSLAGLRAAYVAQDAFRQGVLLAPAYHCVTMPHLARFLSPSARGKQRSSAVEFTARRRPARTYPRFSVAKSRTIRYLPCSSPL